MKQETNFLSLATCIVLKASYYISYLSDREARVAQVPKLCANVKERLKKRKKKKFFGEKRKVRERWSFRVVSRALSSFLSISLSSLPFREEWFAFSASWNRRSGKRCCRSCNCWIFWVLMYYHRKKRELECIK